MCACEKERREMFVVEIVFWPPPPPKRGWKQSRRKIWKESTSQQEASSKKHFIILLHQSWHTDVTNVADRNTLLQGTSTVVREKLWNYRRHDALWSRLRTWSALALVWPSLDRNWLILDSFIHSVIIKSLPLLQSELSNNTRNNSTIQQNYHCTLHVVQKNHVTTNSFSTMGKNSKKKEKKGKAIDWFIHSKERKRCKSCSKFQFLWNSSRNSAGCDDPNQLETFI